jgi:hypothetical protein
MIAFGLLQFFLKLEELAPHNAYIANLSKQECNFCCWSAAPDMTACNYHVIPALWANNL